jgi:tetratricopeptide (TPR) repeat protein
MDENAQEETAVKSRDQLIILGRKLEKDCNVGETLRLLNQLLESQDASWIRERLDDITDNYHRMSDFYLQGYEDPQRQQFYKQLSAQLEGIIRDLILENLKKEYPYLIYLNPQRQIPAVDDMRQRLESYVTDMAMASLSALNGSNNSLTDIHKRHAGNLRSFFNLTVASPQWRHEYAVSFEELLLSPAIDSADAQLLVSAVTLACLLIADAEKILTLIHVFQKSQDERVKQRAFVGWVFALSNGSYQLYDTVRYAVKDVLSDNSVKSALLDMQMQVVYCHYAERDNDELRKNIMPNIIKSHDWQMMNMGSTPTDESSLEEILHPDEADKRMESLEKSINKMNDMRKQGMDIYFGGFSQMKRFAFFNQLYNWLIPYTPTHPDLTMLPEELRNSGFLDKLFKEGPFCDSDKYSFSIALSSVYQRLPPEVRKVLLSGEVSLNMPDESEEPWRHSAYIRRMYLQDLYRFFKLCDQRHPFFNAFGYAHPIMFFTKDMISAEMRQQLPALISFLLKKKLWDSLQSIVACFASSDENKTDGQDVEVEKSLKLASAALRMHDSDYASAADDLKELCKMEPESESLLRQYSLAVFKSGRFEEASEIYKTLTQRYPQKLSYALGLAISLIYCGKADEAVSVLYKLDYEHPDDTEVQRTLAWGLLWMDRTEEAQKIYKGLCSGDKALPDDTLNAAYCFWFQGQRMEAREMLRKYIGLSKLEKGVSASAFLLEKFHSDQNIFEHYRIDDTAQKIMADVD